MALFTTEHVKISGLAAAIPAWQVSNLEFDVIPEKERNLLVKTTGIATRHIAAPGTTTADLCEIAANKLLAALGWTKDSVEILVLVTQTPDYITPASAAILQDKLGLPKSCLAFDINLGCSGYPYGLSVVASLLSQFKKGRALLLVGDVSSACVSGVDKSAAPIFSDAGSATALEYDEAAAPMYFNLQTDGSGFEAIIIPDGGYRNQPTHKSLELENHGPGIDRSKMHLILNGIDIFNFSIREVPSNVTDLLAYAGTNTKSVQQFVFHQANLIINESLRKKLKLEPGQTPLSLSKYGNTSSATIPVTILSEIREAVATKKQTMVFCGFGVGLSWGSALVETEGITCLPIIEV